MQAFCSTTSTSVSGHTPITLNLGSEVTLSSTSTPPGCCSGIEALALKMLVTGMSSVSVCQYVHTCLEQKLSGAPLSNTKLKCCPFSCTGCKIGPAFWIVFIHNLKWTLQDMSDICRLLLPQASSSNVTSAFVEAALDILESAFVCSVSSIAAPTINICRKQKTGTLLCPPNYTSASRPLFLNNAFNTGSLFAEQINQVRNVSSWGSVTDAKSHAAESSRIQAPSHRACAAYLTKT
ncbi:hypothetical protein T07_1482 [Trichinella nelsoni]|uniref:Uncharacterized protein n=1 Tax=Trichinella nelsoni TaxID=6336 RepID=A0A0V0S0S7_9BILA|nr:hypothetical protein T07_1482 [Trichinella nelsoni]